MTGHFHWIHVEPFIYLLIEMPDYIVIVYSQENMVYWKEVQQTALFY